MKLGALGLGVLSGVAVTLLFSSMPGGSRFDVRAGALPLYAKNSSGEIVLSRDAIMARIRQDLGLSPLSSIRVDNLPERLKGPQGGNLSAVLTREADEGSGQYLYLLDLVTDGVARESFYLKVRVGQDSKGLTRETSSGREVALENEATASGVLVKAGDNVHVTARGEGFLIRFSGIAQSDGGVGDAVPVVNPASGVSLSGQVTGRDAVLVVLGGGHS
ncbi:MAG: flagella basal body P-ring formation protein FlgA [Leptospirillia bacterium]